MLLALQKRGLPLFHARLSVPPAPARTRAGKAGLGTLHGGPAPARDPAAAGQDVDDLIESMGAQLSADVSMEEAALALTSLGARRARARCAPPNRVWNLVRRK